MRRLRALLRGNFDIILVVATLAAVGLIVLFAAQKLSYLNFFFLPTMLAGTFLGSRGAVLGALLAVTWVTFFAVLDPDGFSRPIGRLALWGHLVSWAAFLIAGGLLIGTMSEMLRERFKRARRLLGRLRATSRDLSRMNHALDASRHRVESVLYSLVDPAVARLIIDRRLRNEKRPLTVLFADLADFTKYSEDTAPEAVIGEINRFFSAAEPVILRHRGHLDKYLGDGILAEFGVPQPLQHHVLLGTLAAVKLQERMAAGRFPWGLRVSLASGPSLVGLVGSEQRKNYTAIGDTVNVAARLHDVCPVGSVCVDEGVQAQVGRWFELRPLRGAPIQENSAALESRLSELLGAGGGLSADALIEATRLCSRLGDLGRAASICRRAIERDPDRRSVAERVLAESLLDGAARDAVAIRGRRRPVAAYEILRLRDPLDDAARVPSIAAALLRQAAADFPLPEDHVLPVEAMEGSLGHARVRAALACGVAETLGMSEDARRSVILAAFLLDIGKTDLPDFLRPLEGRLGELPPRDQALIKEHPLQAAGVISRLGLDAPADVVEAVAQHHERCDGSGYPRGLYGSRICPAARILALVDSYESLTAWHPHAEPWEPGAALGEMRADIAAGKFDPEAGAAFLSLMARRGR